MRDVTLLLEGGWIAKTHWKSRNVYAHQSVARYLIIQTLNLRHATSISTMFLWIDLRLCCYMWDLGAVAPREIWVLDQQKACRSKFGDTEVVNLTMGVYEKPFLTISANAFSNFLWHNLIRFVTSVENWSCEPTIFSSWRCCTNQYRFSWEICVDRFGSRKNVTILATETKTVVLILTADWNLDTNWSCNPIGRLVRDSFVHQALTS